MSAPSDMQVLALWERAAIGVSLDALEALRAVDMPLDRPLRLWVDLDPDGVAGVFVGPR